MTSTSYKMKYGSFVISILAAYYAGSDSELSTLIQFWLFVLAVLLPSMIMIYWYNLEVQRERLLGRVFAAYKSLPKLYIARMRLDADSELEIKSEK